VREDGKKRALVEAKALRKPECADGRLAMFPEIIGVGFKDLFASVHEKTTHAAAKAMRGRLRICVRETPERSLTGVREGGKLLIMKVHLRQIPQGETLHLEGEEDAAGIGLDEVGAVAASPLRYSMDVGVSEGGLFGSGRLELRVRMCCVACLEEFEQDFEIEPFGFQIELTGNELMDLTPAMREDIHLCLPPHPRCDAVGSDKQCPAIPDSAERAVRQAPERGATAWDVLDKLKSISD